MPPTARRSRHRVESPSSALRPISPAPLRTSDRRLAGSRARELYRTVITMLSDDLLARIAQEFYATVLDNDTSLVVQNHGQVCLDHAQFGIFQCAANRDESRRGARARQGGSTTLRRIMSRPCAPSMSHRMWHRIRARPRPASCDEAQSMAAQPGMRAMAYRRGAARSSNASSAREATRHDGQGQAPGRLSCRHRILAEPHCLQPDPHPEIDRRLDSPGNGAKEPNLMSR
jgi:hypothetical protein